MEIADYLDNYLKGLSHQERAEFIRSCDTSLGYLRNIVGGFGRPSPEFSIKLDKASNGKLSVEKLRPDIDWAYLRNKP